MLDTHTEHPMDDDVGTQFHLERKNNTKLAKRTYIYFENTHVLFGAGKFDFHVRRLNNSCWWCWGVNASESETCIVYMKIDRD